ncbi:MAG: hypothetical protein AB7I48_16265 [Planctomycetaceae bacterium]
MRRILRLIALVFSAALSTLTLAGCFGSSGLETAEVRGRVVMNGQPVTSGRVVFFPANPVGKGAGKPAQAMLDSDGEFDLRTYGRSDGAVIGDHRITVLSNPDPSSGEDAKTLGTPNPSKVTVKAGETNEFEIVLTPRAPGSDREDEDD